VGTPKQWLEIDPDCRVVDGDVADYALNTHQMFSIHSTLEVFKNATITGHFGLLLSEK